MICIVRLGVVGPSMKDQPVGWVISEDFNQAIEQSERVGEFEVASELDKLRGSRKGKYLLSSGDWLLVS